MKVDIKECISGSVLGILERNIRKIDRTVSNFHDRILGIGDGRLFIEYFNDTSDSLDGHREHNVDHGYHHE